MINYHYLQGFSTIPGGFLARFLPSTTPSGKLKLLEIHHHTSNRIRTSTLKRKKILHPAIPYGRHAWNIYLHFAEIYAKCLGKYIIHFGAIWVGKANIMYPVTNPGKYPPGLFGAGVFGRSVFTLGIQAHRN